MSKMIDDMTVAESVRGKQIVLRVAERKKSQALLFRAEAGVEVVGGAFTLLEPADVSAKDGAIRSGVVKVGKLVFEVVKKSVVRGVARMEMAGSGHGGNALFERALQAEAIFQELVRDILRGRHGHDLEDVPGDGVNRRRDKIAS